MNFKGCFEENKFKIFKDERGGFIPIFQKGLQSLDVVKQINSATNKKEYTFRGLHRQHWPYGQTKMVFCLQGSALDIAYDASIKKVVGVCLLKTGLEPNSILVGPNLFHGYITLEPKTEVMYLCDNEYKPESEEIISVMDKTNLGMTIWDEICTMANKKYNLSLYKNTVLDNMVIHQKDLTTKILGSQNG